MYRIQITHTIYIYIYIYIKCREDYIVHAATGACVCVWEKNTYSKLTFALQSFSTNCSPAPGVVALKAHLPKGILLQRSVFSDTGIIPANNLVYWVWSYCSSYSRRWTGCVGSMLTILVTSSLFCFDCRTSTFERILCVINHMYTVETISCQFYNTADVTSLHSESERKKFK